MARYETPRGILRLVRTELRDGHETKLSPREQVLEASLGLVEADAEDDVEYERAWSRLRFAVRTWLCRECPHRPGDVEAPKEGGNGV